MYLHFKAMVQFPLVTVHKVILYRCVETRQIILPGLGEHLRRIPLVLYVLHLFAQAVDRSPNV